MYNIIIVLCFEKPLPGQFLHVDIVHFTYPNLAYCTIKLNDGLLFFIEQTRLSFVKHILNSIQKEVKIQ